MNNKSKSKPVNINMKLMFIVYAKNKDNLLNFLEHSEELIYKIESLVAENSFLGYTDSFINLLDVVTNYSPSTGSFDVLDEDQEIILYNLYKDIILPYARELVNKENDYVNSDNKVVSEFRKQMTELYNKEVDIEDIQYIISYFSSLLYEIKEKRVDVGEFKDILTQVSKSLYESLDLNFISDEKDLSGLEDFYIYVLDIENKIPYTDILDIQYMISALEHSVKDSFGYILIPVDDSKKIKQINKDVEYKISTKRKIYQSFTPVILGGKKGQINYENVRDGKFKSLAKKDIPEEYLEDQGLTEEIITVLLNKISKDTTVKYQFDKLSFDLEIEASPSALFDLMKLGGSYDKSKVADVCFKEEELSDNIKVLAYNYLVYKN